MGRGHKSDKFPLHLLATGRWAKKIRGRRHYFGVDRDKALAEYVRVRADLEGGMLHSPKGEDALTVFDLVNNFLHARRADVESDGLSTRRWDEYKATTETIVAELGRDRTAVNLTPDDFGRGPSCIDRVDTNWSQTAVSE
jgi:hypothetical protein